MGISQPNPTFSMEKNILRSSWVIACILGVFTLSLGRNLLSDPPNDNDANSARARIEKMVEKLRSDSNVSSLTMKIERPAWKRELKIKVWDERKNNRVFLAILSPPKEDGIAYLRVGSNLWNYLPRAEKVLKLPLSLMLQPWMGSDFTNDDLVKEGSYVEDYQHKIIKNEVQEGEEVLLIELIPLPKAPVVWGSVIFWIRKNDNLPLRQQFFDEKGKLIKDLHFSDFKILDGNLLPTRWTMVPVTKKDHRTILEINEIDFDPSPPISPRVFTQDNLRK